MGHRKPPGQQLAARTEAGAYRKRLMKWFDVMGVHPRVNEINSYHALMACASAGMGVGIVPESIIDAHPSIVGFKKHALPSEFASSITSAVWREDRVKPATLAFLQCLCG